MTCDLRYHPDTEQLALVESLGSSLESMLPLSRLHESPSESERIWSELEALGIFGISVAEEEGGSGLGVVEETLIAMELGRHLASPSVFATMGAAHAESGENIAPRIMPAYRKDKRVVIIDDDLAARVLVHDENGAALYNMPTSCSEIEANLWLDRLCEANTDEEAVAEFDNTGLLHMQLIYSAALCGIARRALDMAVEYAGLREQFGRPIGSFQAIKHHCTNMAIAGSRAKDQIQFAAVAMADEREDALLQVNCALLAASRAALDNAALNIQVHGGIGFSAEADPHLLIKRAQIFTALAGGAEAINQKVASTAAPG